MISRVADHAFWLGRYVERAESTARLLATTHNLALDAELEPSACWGPVIVVAGEEERFKDRGRSWDDGEQVEQFLTWDEDAVSIRESVIAARWNARSIREVVSLEAWETTNELHLWLKSAEATAQFADHRYEFYRRVRSMTQLCLGLLRSTMLHDEPLDFMWLGVLLERVNQTARMLDVHHHAFTNLPRRHEVVETALWLSMLRALSGSEAYLKRAAGRVSSEGVARFLVSEPAFPRSIAYCVHSAYGRLCDIRPPLHHTLPGGVSLERLRVLDAWISAREQEPLSGTAVHDVLTHVVDEVHEICGTLGRELLGAD